MAGRSKTTVQHLVSNPNCSKKWRRPRRPQQRPGKKRLSGLPQEARWSSLRGRAKQRRLVAYLMSSQAQVSQLRNSITASETRYLLEIIGDRFGRVSTLVVFYSPWQTGFHVSQIPPMQTPSWTVSFKMPIDFNLYWRFNERDVPPSPCRRLDL